MSNIMRKTATAACGTDTVCVPSPARQRRPSILPRPSRKPARKLAQMAKVASNSPVLLGRGSFQNIGQSKGPQGRRTRRWKDLDERRRHG